MERAIKHREPLIDIIKGFCALNIVVIHTAFWSGDAYVPHWVRSFTLLLDVPLFFFLSGWGSGLGKMGNLLRTCKNLWRNVFFKAMLLVPLVYIIRVLTGRNETFETTKLLANFSLAFDFESFLALKGSSWFFRYYLRAVFFNQLAIAVIRPGAEKYGYNENHILAFLLLFNLSLFLMRCGEVDYLSLNFDQKDYFYNSMWLLGAVLGRKNIKIKRFGFLLLLLSANALLYVVAVIRCGCDFAIVDNMKNATLPVQMLPWFFYSMFSILVLLHVRAVFVKEKGICRFLTHIGKNAIYYFFAQGISSSLIWGLTIYADKAWYIRFAFMLVLNMTMAIVFAEGLALMEKVVLMVLRVLAGSKTAQRIKTAVLTNFGLRISEP